MERRVKPRPLGAPVWSESARARWKRTETSQSEQVAKQPTAVASLQKRRARPVVYVLTTLLLLLVLLAVDGAYVVYQSRSALRLTADYLTRARTSLTQGDVELARRQASAAQDAVLSAQSAARRPSFALGSRVPIVRDDLLAVAAIIEAAEKASLAALAGASASEEVQLFGPDVTPSIYRDGRVDLDAIERAAPFVNEAVRRLIEAMEALEVPSRVHMSEVRTALASARSTIAEARSAALGIDRLFTALPAVLGDEGTRRYMLAFQALGEARATGGVIGLVGVLQADGGRIQLEEVAPTLELFPGPVPSVDSPLWFRASYERQAATRQIQQANVSPNFPVVAEILLEMYEAAENETLDGVMMMDAVTLGQFLGATDPIESQFFAEPLTSATAADAILRDSYLEFSDEDSQNRFLRDVVDQFWQRVATGRVDTEAFASAIQTATETGHLKMFVRDEGAQSSLADLDVVGDFPIANPMTQMVFHSNYSVNKVDFFIERDISTEVDLAADGSATVTITARLENAAPEGPPSVLLGPNVEGDPAGLNRMLLSFLLPRAAQQVELDAGDAESDVEQWTEDTFPVHSILLEIPAGGSAEAIVSYALPGAFDPTAASASFELELLPQTLVNPDTYSVVVTPPPGWGIVETHNAVLEGARAITRGTLLGDTLVRIGLNKPS